MVAILLDHTGSCRYGAAIDAWDTSGLGDAAEHVPGNCVLPACDFAGGDLLRLLPTDENNLIAALNFLERRHVYHDLVHGDATDDRATRSANQQLRLV
jgi:hypothetical protein